MRFVPIAPAVFAGVALALSACSNPGEAPSAETPPSATPVVLGGVDLGQPLRALGTEPFWAVEITPQALTYSGVDQASVTVANPGPTVQGTTAVYAAADANGAPLVVTLIATECSDGMSDRVYPLTARVELRSQNLNGCAASVAFLETSPAP